MQSLHICQCTSEILNSLISNTIKEIVIYNSIDGNPSFAQFSQLEKLSIPSIDPSELQQISPSLSSLKIGSFKETLCSQYDFIGIRFAGLKKLNLPTLSSEGFKKLVHCPHLETLIIRDCSSLRDKDFEEVFPKLAHIKHLELSSLSHVSYEGLISLYSCTQLVFLTIVASPWCNDFFLQGIGALPFLRSLKLVNVGITGSGFGIPCCFPSLTELSLESCKKFEPNALSLIGKNVLQLEKLYLSSISIENGICSSVGFVRLRVLRIYDCSLTDDDLFNIRDNAPRLEKLILLLVAKMSGMGLWGSSWKRLHTVEVLACGHVSIAGSEIIKQLQSTIANRGKNSRNVVDVIRSLGIKKIFPIFLGGIRYEKGVK